MGLDYFSIIYYAWIRFNFLSAPSSIIVKKSSGQTASQTNNMITSHRSACMINHFRLWRFLLACNHSYVLSVCRQVKCEVIYQLYLWVLVARISSVHVLKWTQEKGIDLCSVNESRMSTQSSRTVVCGYLVCLSFDFRTSLIMLMEGCQAQVLILKYYEGVLMLWMHIESKK